MVGNGASVHVTSRSAAVAARGHAVRLVTVGDVLPSPGLDVRSRPLPGGMAAGVSAARGFFQDLREFDPDLVHLHYAGGRLGTLTLLSGIRPLVVTVMGGDVLPEQHPGGLSRLQRRTTRRILREADLVLVKADALRPVVTRLGAAPENVETVRWGVDPAVFKPDPEAAAGQRARLGLAPADRVILSPRLLKELYNVHLVVEALPLVLRDIPSAVLVITEYGADPVYRRHLEQRTRELGIADRVRFAGRVDHGQMPALYSLADVAVSVPSSDGLPQSHFEAMACGCPLVTGRLEVYREVLEDGHSALMTSATPDAIAQAVSSILKDEALRSRLAAAARARVSEVGSLPPELDRLERAYARVARAEGRPRKRRLRVTLEALTFLFR
jgi:glycosyltransferase involved in cell wall biosynthesis